MDAPGSERAALFGISEGGALSMLFAATCPERTRALVFYGTYARHPTLAPESLPHHMELIERYWEPANTFPGPRRKVRHRTRIFAAAWFGSSGRAPAQRR